MENDGLTKSATSRPLWFWLSILTVLLWGAWAILAKVASQDIPAKPIQFLFTIGALPVVLALLVAKRFRIGSNRKGVGYSLANGIASGIGMIALYAAFRSGGNTAVIMVTTALYPMITVVLALVILHERLTKYQVMGLILAAAAIVIFSL